MKEQEVDSAVDRINKKGRIIKIKQNIKTKFPNFKLNSLKIQASPKPKTHGLLAR